MTIFADFGGPLLHAPHMPALYYPLWGGTYENRCVITKVLIGMSFAYSKKQRCKKSVSAGHMGVSSNALPIVCRLYIRSMDRLY